MRVNRAPRLKKLLGATCLLLTAATTAAEADDCGFGCHIFDVHLSASSDRDFYEPGGRVVYSLTVRNLGALAVENVELTTRTSSWAEGPGCATENQHWTRPDAFNPWKISLGVVGASQSVTVPFCLEVPESLSQPEADCDPLRRWFSVSGHRRGYAQQPLDSVGPVTHLRSECPLRACLSGELGAAGPCCVVEALHCLVHPTDRLCTGTTATPTPVNRLVAGVAAAAKYFEAATDLARLYFLRDEVLASTPGGRGAIALYETHQAELKRLLLPDPALRGRALDLISSWRPVIDRLAERGGPTTITAAQVAELQSFLAELRVVASPALRQAIDRESQALDFDAFAGLSADQGLQRLNKLSCIPGATTLCLSAGRVRVETAWETGDGQRGSGRAVALTGDTGTFWFFNAANIETIVKVVDACTYNDRRWVFAAGLTDVGVVTTVTDIATGAVRTYSNPVRRRFAPIQDTDAFDCSP